MVQDSPSRKLDQYIVRFPAGMRDQLKEAAKKNNRSLNAEIISRLELTLKTVDSDIDTTVKTENASVKSLVNQMGIFVNILGGAMNEAAQGDRTLLEKLIEVAKANPINLDTINDNTKDD